MIGPIFGMTTVNAKTSPSGQASNVRLSPLTKYVGCNADRNKVHYYKFAEDITSPRSEVLMKINTDLTDKYPATNANVSNWKYIPEKNLIVSIQSSNVVFEDAETHEVLGTSTITSCTYSSASLYSMMCIVQNSLFYIQQSFAYGNGAHDDIGLVVEKYDLDTYEKTVIKNLSFSGVQPQGSSSRPTCSVIDGKYLVYGLEYRPYNNSATTATTAHSYVYLYDAVANQEITIRNDETLSTTAVSACNVIGTKTQLGNVYVVSTIADGKNVKIHKYDPDTHTISVVATNSATNQRITSNQLLPYVIGGLYEDSNYFMCGAKSFSKSDCTYRSVIATISNQNGDIIYSGYESGFVFIQNNKTYIWINNHIVDIGSSTVDISGNTMTCVGYKFYNIFGSGLGSNRIYGYYYTFPNNNDYITMNCREAVYLTRMTRVNVDDTNNCLNMDNSYGLSVTVIPSVETNSLDYDYSTLYCYDDFFVQFKEKAAVTDSEYNDLVELSEEILGES